MYSSARLGHSDPDYITSFIKALLNKRNKLLKQGHKVEADVLAYRINSMIANVLHHRRETLADAGVKALWNTVKAKKEVNENSRATRLTSDVEAVIRHFANVSFDSSYKLENVTAFRQVLGSKDDSYKPLYSF